MRKENKEIRFDHPLLDCLSFDLWFQFTILNIVDSRFDYYYIARRSSIDRFFNWKGGKKKGKKWWKYVIGISKHWNYWNPTGNLGKTELEKVIIPTGCIPSPIFSFLPFFLFFFSFQKEYRKREGEGKEVVLHRLAISNPRREHILAADRLPSWKHCYGFNISWERSPLVGYSS